MTIMQVDLIRGPSTDMGTFSNLVFGPHQLRAVELPDRGNCVGQSCIPRGRYRCELTDSPSKGRVYEVKNVDGRTHILIHAANFAGDIDLGWQSELEGCIAPGMSIGFLENKDGKPQRAMLHSRMALELLMGWAGGQPFDLVIS